MINWFLTSCNNLVLIALGLLVALKAMLRFSDVEVFGNLS